MENESVLRAAVRAAAIVLLCALLARWLAPPSSAPSYDRAETLAPAPPKYEDDDAPADEREWRHSISLEGAQPLTVHTRVRRGEMSFRFDATLDASVSEVLSLARETDLMPVWNPYCREAGVSKLNGLLDLWAWADFKFSPLPVPPMFVVVHATLADRTATDGHWHVRVASSPPADEGGADAHDRSAVPADVLTHGEVQLTYAVARLIAVRRHPARTRVVAEIAMDLTKLSVLGPIRYLTPPAWLVNVVTKIMIPGVWRACLQAIRKIQADGKSGPIGARLAADSTGVYRKIRRATGQST